MHKINNLKKIAKTDFYIQQLAPPLLSPFLG